MTSSTPLQVPFTEIKSVTNNFSDESVIGEGFLGKNYGGQLSLSGEMIDVAFRRLDHSFWLQDIAFDKEFSMLSSLKHKNLVSNVGFCNEKDEIIIINKREALGSLNRHLSGTTLNWMKRLEICVGVASALSYLHNAGVIHHNVNSTSILLDEKWDAKLSGFEYSMKVPAGDLDLAYEKLGIGTYKSDVFSFGVLLFDILCGTKAFISAENNKFQAPLAIFQFEGRKLHKLVDQDLFKQMDPQSFNIYSETAYYCLKEGRSPISMNQVLTRLKSALKLQEQYENDEHSTVVRRGPSSNNLKLKLKNLEHMRFQFEDIKLATNKFSADNCIASGGFGTVYKAELDHVDREYCLAIEGKKEGELPTGCSKVAIKRIFDTEDGSGEQGFYAEIDMLTSCKHSNILTLLGFCDEGSAMMLIYEYASNGSLEDYLKSKGNMENDSWARRLKICLQVARGLSYLHTREGGRQEIVHRDIKSANILLDENLDARIGDFGLCKLLSVNEEHKGIAGTPVYMDPQYVKEGKLKKELDIYSLGVVLIEVLCGRLAYDPIYRSDHNQGLALTARQHFDKGTIKTMVDGRLELTRKSVTRPNQESLYIFSKLAYQCLEQRQEDRPTIEAVIRQLEKALHFQAMNHLEIPLNDIISATQYFSEEYCIGEGGRGTVYRAQLCHFDREKVLLTYETNIDELPKKFSIVAIRRLCIAEAENDDRELNEEIELITRCEHRNVVSLLGFVREGGQRILIYEYSSRGSLDRYLMRDMTWLQRIKTCIGVARGLNYIHKQNIIHRDIKSSNILLDTNWEAKISDFGVAELIPANQQANTLVLDNIVGTRLNMDNPEYRNTGMLRKASDVYSFGVVLVEILSGRWAYDPAYTKKNEDGVAPLFREWFSKGTIYDMVHPQLKEEIDENNFTLNRGPCQESLDTFSKLAYECLSVTHEKRPTAEAIIRELEKALYLQVNRKDKLIVSLKDIESATDNFSEQNIIGNGALGRIYKGTVQYAKGEIFIAVKRLDIHTGQEEQKFLAELEILLGYKHINVIGFVGYYKENDERIFVYELASNKSLDLHLGSHDLTWTKRLEIVIDVASGLEFLHGGGETQETVIHRDINSGNILLNGDWRAKISDFRLALKMQISKETDYVIDNVVGSLGYLDPLYESTGFLTKESDIYSFGVVLFEVLCGRCATDQIYKDRHLPVLAKHHFNEGTIKEIVLDRMKEKIVPESLITYSRIAFQCILHERKKRPTISEVIVQLKKALEFQEDYEAWEPKLPRDYREIIRMSISPEIYSSKKKEDLYNMFTKGILLQQGKVSVSLGDNGDINEMTSARIFSYTKCFPYKWNFHPESRFEEVAEMLDISDLMIDVQPSGQFLSPNTVYGVHLVFKFGNSRMFSSKTTYVNLKYRMANECLHAYFATRRDDEWMMIELCRFLNHKEHVVFKFVLESFSPYYCGDGVIYVEGIEFRAIDRVKQEEIVKLKEVQQVVSYTDLNADQVQQPPTNYDNDGKVFRLISEVNGKKHLVISAKAALYKSSNVGLFTSKPSAEARFHEVIELLPQQVFRINCMIERNMLARDTEYGCFLVFKITENCHGLHCPVKVVDLLHQENKEAGVIYFTSPSPWNIHDITQVSKQRKDGWMEVNVWQFNSSTDEVENDCVPVKLKLISYEGTMSGLIVEGVEFRPM